MKVLWKFLDQIIWKQAGQSTTSSTVQNCVLTGTSGAVNQQTDQKASCLASTDAEGTGLYQTINSKTSSIKPWAIFFIKTKEKLEIHQLSEGLKGILWSNYSYIFKVYVIPYFQNIKSGVRLRTTVYSGWSNIPTLKKCLHCNILISSKDFYMHLK